MVNILISTIKISLFYPPCPTKGPYPYVKKTSEVGLLLIYGIKTQFTKPWDLKPLRA
jgi:hypothetical protein